MGFIDINGWMLQSRFDPGGHRAFPCGQSDIVNFKGIERLALGANAAWFSRDGTGGEHFEVHKVSGTGIGNPTEAETEEVPRKIDWWAVVGVGFAISLFISDCLDLVHCQWR